MKANYQTRLKIPGVIDRTLNARETRVAEAMWDEANRQWEAERDRLMDVVLETYLVVLHRRYRFGRDVLRRIWEDCVSLRAGMRSCLRDIGSGQEYQIQKTGQNIEDTAIRMELADIGVDVRAWEAAVAYDEKTGQVIFRDREMEMSHDSKLSNE